jgi:hypothetical protein
MHTYEAFRPDVIAAMKADMTAVDRGESISAMEPLVITNDSRHRGTLNDLAFELTQKSAGLRRSLPRPIQAPLATLVRAMNCYYSNLIEGRTPASESASSRECYAGKM